MKIAPLDAVAALSLLCALTACGVTWPTKTPSVAKLDAVPFVDKLPRVPPSYDILGAVAHIAVKDKDGVFHPLVAALPTDSKDYPKVAPAKFDPLNNPIPPQIYDNYVSNKVSGNVQSAIAGANIADNQVIEVYIAEVGYGRIKRSPNRRDQEAARSYLGGEQSLQHWRYGRTLVCPRSDGLQYEY